MPCELCQRANKTGQRKVPMIERPIITKLFEKIAVDIVGPLPKGKGGAEHILTVLCMASRWPEAIPHRKITARGISEAMMPVFSKIGLPLQILSDQGSQFNGKLAKDVCKLLQIERVRTTAYHPQTHWMIEWFHGTFESMLTKAVDLGLDWIGQIPFALFAIRQSPCKTTGFSPFKLVYGRNVRTPLDILYEGWRDETKQEFDTSTWVQQLGERMQAMWDSAVAKGLRETQQRKVLYDRGKVERYLNVGDLVMCRIPGLCKKLRDAWEGPFRVQSELSAVNYKVKEVQGKERMKTIHINNAKRYVE